MKIPLKANIRKANEVYILTIPGQYIKNGLLYEGQEINGIIVKDETGVFEDEQ